MGHPKVFLGAIPLSAESLRNSFLGVETELGGKLGLVVQNCFLLLPEPRNTGLHSSETKLST